MRLVEVTISLIIMLILIGLLTSIFSGIARSRAKFMERLKAHQFLEEALETETLPPQIEVTEYKHYKILSVNGETIFLAK